MLIKDFTIEHILSQLSRDKINVLFVAEHTPLDIPSLIQAANQTALKIAGGVFPMVVQGEQTFEKGIILKFAESSDPVHLLKDIDFEELAQDLPDFSNSTQSCIVLTDGLMEGAPRVLHQLYEKYWHGLSFLGGGAGSLTLKQTPCVFSNEGLHENAVLLIPLRKKAKSGVKHGWQKLAGPFIANKTDGNTILELNWRPAFEVYKEVLESYGNPNFETTAFFDIAKGHPFGIQKEGQEVIVRDPIAVNEKGHLYCVGPVSQNVSLYVLGGDKYDLIRSAREAANIACENPDYEDSLVIDCISRILYLEEDFPKELQAIDSEFTEKGTLEGALTLGEISSGIKGLLELYNKTTVVTTFS